MHTWPNGYQFRSEIVIPAASIVGGTHKDFPLLIRDEARALRSVANGGKVASDQGWDMRFELEDGQKRPHDLVH